MKKIKAYKYLGRNGILISKILIEGVDHIPMLMLKADTGKVLTNGEISVHSVTIEENELQDWREIADKNN